MLKISFKMKVYMKVFMSKFLCNNLYLLFVIFIIICNHVKTKVFSITGTSHWMIGSSLKSIIGVTFVGKCPWLMYIHMICLTYCFPFSSVITTLIDVASCIFKLNDFNCSNPFVVLPFSKLDYLGHSLTSHMEIMKR